ncbi:hypothetical protein D3C76_1022370 [compost metagenome]
MIDIPALQCVANQGHAPCQGRIIFPLGSIVAAICDNRSLQRQEVNPVERGFGSLIGLSKRHDVTIGLSNSSGNNNSE